MSSFLAKLVKNRHATSAPTHYEVYADYNKILRNWFVAFGIGAAVALSTQDKLVEVLKSRGHLACIVWALVIGATLQIVIAWINKTCAWMEYYASENPAYGRKLPFRLCSWIYHQFGIDVAVDVITIVLFGYAIFEVARAFIAIPRWY